jgi:hypothetical protein
MNRVRIAGERVVDAAIGVANRSRAVDVCGSADAIDDVRDARTVAEESTLGGLER